MPYFEPRGKYLEDIVIGEETLSPGRTISSADVELFGEWTGDQDSSCWVGVVPGDTRRAASPLLIGCIVDALNQRLGFVEGTGYCSLGWTWTFLKPVYEMDTIWAKTRWTNARPLKSRPYLGLVEEAFEIINQDEEVVAQATWTGLILRRVLADHVGRDDN